MVQRWVERLEIEQGTYYRLEGDLTFCHVDLWYFNKTSYSPAARVELTGIQRGTYYKKLATILLHGTQLSVNCAAVSSYADTTSFLLVRFIAFSLPAMQSGETLPH